MLKHDSLILLRIETVSLNRSNISEGANTPFRGNVAIKWKKLLEPCAVERLSLQH